MKKISKIFIVILIVLIMTAYNTMCFASNKTELQKEQSDINSSINEAKEDLKNIQKEKSATLSQVENLMSQIADYQEEIDDLESKINDLEKQIKESEEKINEDEKEYQKKQTALNERLVAIYENGDISYLDVLLSSSSLTDFISSYYMVSELTSYDTEMLRLIEEEKQKIENEKQELEENKKSLDTAKESKVEKNNALKTAKAEKENKAKELSNEEKETQKEIQEMLEDKAEIDRQLKKIAEQEAAAARAAENSKKKGSSNSTTTYTPTVAPSAAGYIFPVAGCSKANINNKSFPSYAGHTGVDVNINVTGKNVVAVKDGVVSISTALKNSNGSYRSYGEYVVISHGDGTMTLYAHMLAGSRTVSEGQKVSQGQKLGIVGSTGNSTGTHLHFEVRTLSNGGKAVNPLPYLP